MGGVSADNGVGVGKSIVVVMGVKDVCMFGRCVKKASEVKVVIVGI